MPLETLIYIIIAGILALFIALFQYKYKSKGHQTLTKVFVFLRFATLFSIFVLLINPKFEQLKLYNEKPNLVIAIDNSSSVKYLKQDHHVLDLVKRLKNNAALKEKFDIAFYSFGKKVLNTDTLTFSERETHIDKLFSQLSQVYNTTIAPTVFISDGNQTYGNDYSIAAKTYNQPLYPVILGDTITYTDLKIQQLNVNKYAYLKNEFPVEALLSYSGNSEVHTAFEIYLGNTKIYNKTIHFSKTKNSEILNLSLPANQAGVRTYKAVLQPVSNEKNTVNNTKNFAVEVIDQKTKIALVSTLLHPDLGMFKKSIESNEQRAVTIVKPQEALEKLQEFQLFILYQPNPSFENLMSALNNQKTNSLTVAATKTDLHFLNRISEHYQFEITNQTEDFQAERNINYAPFLLENLDFESFPPLKSNYGAVLFSSAYETLLNKKVNTVSTTEPLWATFEINGKREGLLLGENIWQWRAQSFVNTKSFANFDRFIENLIQYLASSKQRDRLNITYEASYNGNQSVMMEAQVFDKNYVFDARERLTIYVKDELSKTEKSFSFVLKNNAYQVDLSNLPASQYHFRVVAEQGNISKSGTFHILDYNAEQQFLNANVSKLQQLAMSSQGTSYFIARTESLENDLINDSRFQTIQKSQKSNTSLIDWKYLLFIIALSLSLEWFLRKYNGLI
ncbi:VWA domain-containing protein [Mariniflexile ostreae]|uniref:VWA domain-containing protein n=1 Tax=Mariniflexile ostreae TaxID=1520892 RepID=A0ABV5FE01_9FLAO